MSRPRFDAKPQYDIVQTETQVSNFESLMTLHCNVQHDHFFFICKEKREKIRRGDIIDPNNAIFGIILLFIENDGHMTNQMTY